MKKLEEYKFEEIVDMKREEFDEALSATDFNIGSLESLRKLLSITYDNMKIRIDALSSLANKDTTSDEDKKKAVDTIEQMYLIMFSMEYKATAIYERVKKSQEQLS